MISLEELKRYSDAYYSGNQLISDAEYDALLKEYEKENGVIENKILGSDLKGISKKYKLPITMGTFEKVHTEQEFKKWWSKYSGDVVAELKVDGCSACLVYENGKLTKVLSRGDGFLGEEINNVFKANNVVKEIPNFSGYIRGEVVIKQTTFDSFFSKEYANPRNTAAGLVKRLDGTDCEKLSFIAYEVFDNNNVVDKTEDSKISFLNSVGFETPLFWKNPNFDEIVSLRNNLKQLKEKADYACDGIVIKQNSVDKEDLMLHTPKKNVAFKPEAEIEITTVLDIEWNLQGSVYSPVAILEPVELDGTTVSRATLHNLNVMKELGIEIGCKVEIIKSGMIIPKILKVVEHSGKGFVYPTTCEACGEQLVVNSSGFPECINQNCQRKISHRFSKMFDILGIKGTGDAFISYMEEHGITVSDFFEIIARKDEETLNRFAGNINGGKILKQMINVLSKPISTAKFLALFDYKGFDEKKLKLIGKPLDEMYNLTFDDLIKIDGFAEKTANLFLSFMHDCKEEIEDIKHYFIIGDAVVSSGKLNGLSFCFTGAACKPRKELQMLVEENGGIVKNGVAKGLNYLVSDDKNSGSSKMVKAKSLGITLISSEEFLEMICQ